MTTKRLQYKLQAMCEQTCAGCTKFVEVSNELSNRIADFSRSTDPALTGNPDGSPSPLAILAGDIVAALTVLGYRECEPEKVLRRPIIGSGSACIHEDRFDPKS